MKESENTSGSGYLSYLIVRRSKFFLDSFLSVESPTEKEEKKSFVESNFCFQFRFWSLIYLLRLKIEKWIFSNVIAILQTRLIVDLKSVI